MMYCLWRGLGRDRLTLYRNSQWYITEESAEHNSQNEMIDEYLLKGRYPCLNQTNQLNHNHYNSH